MNTYAQIENPSKYIYLIFDVGGKRKGKNERQEGKSGTE